MPIPRTPPADLAGLIEADRTALLHLLRALKDSEWNAPTPCPGWSVLDLAVHVLGSDLGVIARDRDGFFGTAPPDTVGSETDFVAFLDDLNDLWVRAGRRLSPPLVIGMLEWTGGELVTTYRRQDPEALTAVVTWASDEPVPKWLDQGRELTERWVHHQQIRHAVGLADWLEPEMTGVVLSLFSWAYPFRLSAFPRPPGTAVEVEVAGDIERVWRFVAGDDGWSRSAEEDGDEPVVRLRLDVGTAWRLLTNGLPPDGLPSPTVDEDHELADALLATRAIIGLPDMPPAGETAPAG